MSESTQLEPSKKHRGLTGKGIAPRAQMVPGHACDQMPILGWDITRDVVAGIELRRRWVADVELLFLAKVFRVKLTELFPSRVSAEDVSRLIHTG